jgi:hypothetical protein
MGLSIAIIFISLASVIAMSEWYHRPLKKYR